MLTAYLLLLLALTNYTFFIRPTYQYVQLSEYQSFTSRMVQTNFQLFLYVRITRKNLATVLYLYPWALVYRYILFSFRNLKPNWTKKYRPQTNHPRPPQVELVLKLGLGKYSVLPKATTECMETLSKYATVHNTLAYPLATTTGHTCMLWR